MLSVCERWCRVNSALSAACFSSLYWLLRKKERKRQLGLKQGEEAGLHISWKRRAKMDAGLPGQVQSKVSQTRNKSKRAWKAVSRLRALSSRTTSHRWTQKNEAWLQLGSLQPWLSEHSQVFLTHISLLFWPPLSL